MYSLLINKHVNIVERKSFFFAECKLQKPVHPRNMNIVFITSTHSLESSKT